MPGTDRSPENIDFLTVSLLHFCRAIVGGHSKTELDLDSTYAAEVLEERRAHAHELAAEIVEAEAAGVAAIEAEEAERAAAAGVPVDEAVVAARTAALTKRLAMRKRILMVRVWPIGRVAIAAAV